MNPYQVLPLYDNEQISKYMGKKLGELPPHIFAIADNAYSNMMRNDQDQCVVVRWAIIVHVMPYNVTLVNPNQAQNCKYLGVQKSLHIMQKNVNPCNNV